MFFCLLYNSRDFDEDLFAREEVDFLVAREPKVPRKGGSISSVLNSRPPPFYNMNYNLRDLNEISGVARYGFIYPIQYSSRIQLTFLSTLHFAIVVILTMIFSLVTRSILS